MPTVSTKICQPEHKSAAVSFCTRDETLSLWGHQLVTVGEQMLDLNSYENWLWNGNNSWWFMAWLKLKGQKLQAWIKIKKILNHNSRDHCNGWLINWRHLVTLLGVERIAFISRTLREHYHNSIAFCQYSTNCFDQKLFDLWLFRKKWDPPCCPIVLCLQSFPKRETFVRMCFYWQSVLSKLW